MSSVIIVEISAVARSVTSAVTIAVRSVVTSVVTNAVTSTVTSAVTSAVTIAVTIAVTSAVTGAASSARWNGPVVMDSISLYGRTEKLARFLGRLHLIWAPGKSPGK